MVVEDLKRIAALHAKGDLQAARTAGDAVLERHPDNAMALQFVGIIHCQAGDVQKGAALLRRALDANPGDLANRLNLARALSDLGRWDEAEALCQSVEGAEIPPELQRMRAETLKGQGRLWEAIQAYEVLVTAQPGDFESWNNLGNARHESGDLPGALSALQQARSLNPKSSLVHVNLARALMSMDRYEEACLALEQAALQAPSDPAPLLELGRTLTSISQPAAALRALGAAARLNPRDPGIFGAMGIAFTDLGDLGQAERVFRFALQAGPSFAPAYLQLGILLEKQNRLDELKALIGQAGKAGVAGGELDYLRALLLSREGEGAEALELIRSVETRSIDAAILAEFKGRLADRLNLVDEAYAAFQEMNRLAAESPLGTGVDRTAYQRSIEAISAQTTGDWFSAWPGISIPADPPSPAFMVGFPRSGTTLLDTVLMGHSDTHVLEEIPILEGLANEIGGFTRLSELSEEKVAELRGRYFAELAKVSPPSPGQLVIDKNPLSMLRVPLIHRLFPDAKIILVLRHPCDVVLSCFMQNFKVTEAMASFLDLQNASLTYDRIFSYWERCREIFPINVHSVRYEDFVQDLEAEVRPLLEFLDLPWEGGTLDHQRTALERGYIRTPSYSQVTQPIYKGASGRWERYRSQMAPVLPLLAPWAGRYGYSVD